MPIPLEFDQRNFYFKNGRLKYCPSLISPCHNIVEIPLNVGQLRRDQTLKLHSASSVGSRLDAGNRVKYMNLIFVSKIISQFFNLQKHLQSQRLKQQDKQSQLLYKLMTMAIEFEYSEATSCMSAYEVSENFLAFVGKLKELTKEFICQNREKACEAKLLIRNNYVHIDSAYALHTN